MKNKEITIQEYNKLIENRMSEHDIQSKCVELFKQKYPKELLFAIPNGGKRGIFTAKKMKKEGVTKGVADMFLPIPRKLTNEINELSDVSCGLFIEFKTKNGCQSKEQREFQKYVEDKGYEYVIVRSVYEFLEIINNYLK